MKEQKKSSPTKNDNYTDAFPVNDNNKKREDTGVRDKSRPFDNSRRDTKTKDYNPTGTTLNDKHPFKDK